MKSTKGKPNKIVTTNPKRGDALSPTKSKSAGKKYNLKTAGKNC